MTPREEWIEERIAIMMESQELTLEECRKKAEEMAKEVFK